jgi:hypothetical protein
MSEKTIVALYDRFEDANAALADIVQAGADREKISMLANHVGTGTALVVNPSFAREDICTDTDSQSGVVTGAEVGLGLGGILGLLATIGTVAIPGIGPLIAIGAWATIAAAAAAGGIVGGIIGAFTDRGVTDADAHLYAEGLKRGGTLVTVIAPSDLIDRVTQIFKDHHAVDIEKRGKAWTAEGWVSFDPAGHPLSEADIDAARSSCTGHEADHHSAIRHYFHPAGLKGESGGGATNVGTHYAEDVIKN